MSLKFACVYVECTALIYLVFITSSCDLHNSLRSHKYKISSNTMDTTNFSYSIDKTWNNELIVHEHVRLTLQRENNNLRVNITAPFFNSPEKPQNKPGDFFDLWNYEGCLISFFFFFSLNNLYP